jgi:hypothetical protein
MNSFRVENHDIGIHPFLQAAILFDPGDETFKCPGGIPVRKMQ